MTKAQRYIIFIIILSSLLVVLIIKSNIFTQLFGVSQTNRNTILPESIGDPLELVLVKPASNFSNDFYKSLNNLIGVDIGPSPQSERLLAIMEFKSVDFLGIVKRHQNLLFLEESDEFSISFTNNLFANNQLAIVLKTPLNQNLNIKKEEISSIAKKIKQTELKRMVYKFQNYSNKEYSQGIKEKHGFRMVLPKDFSLAYKDSTISWFRRETPKISQGVFIANITTLDRFALLNHLNNYSATHSYKSASFILSQIDSIIRPHILGPIDGSYMQTDKFFLNIDTLNSSVNSGDVMLNNSLFAVSKLLRSETNIETYKIQSLWRMENDFMGGIYIAYLFFNQKTSEATMIYTYLFAPGEKKSINLLQLEAVVETIRYN